MKLWAHQRRECNFLALNETSNSTPPYSYFHSNEVAGFFYVEMKPSKVICFLYIQHVIKLYGPE
jgi:hypothetical protein